MFVMRDQPSDPVLSGVAAIARHLYDDDSPKAQRRARHLIDTGVLPHKKIGFKIEARASWIDAVYDQPDPPKNGQPRK
jgi:hypothetical protein